MLRGRVVRGYRTVIATPRRRQVLPTGRRTRYGKPPKPLQIFRQGCGFPLTKFGLGLGDDAARLIEVRIEGALGFGQPPTAILEPAGAESQLIETELGTGMMITVLPVT